MKNFIPSRISLNKSGFSIVTYSILAVLSDGLLSQVISSFFKSFIKKNKKYFLLLKLNFQDSGYKTLHKGIVVNYDSLSLYIKYCINIFSIKSNDYHSELITEIEFNFFEIDPSREDYYINKWSEIKLPQPIKLDTFSNGTIKSRLPLNMDYNSWGDLDINNPDLKIISSYLGTFIIKIASKIDIILKQGSTEIIRFSDYKYSNDLFIREMNSDSFTIKYYIKTNDKIVLMTKEDLKTKFLTRIKKQLFKDPMIMTIDIETKVVNGVHTPYLFSVYDGKKSTSFFSDNPSDLFNYILRRKYDGYTIFVHNLSMFDIIFLLKYVPDLRKDGFKVNIIKKDNKFISIKIYNNIKNISVTFRDSYLLLPSSLSKLSAQFKVETPKGIEPVFIGDPKSPYFMADLSHYSKDIEKITDISIWKEKIQTYCETDCISLYQVLIKFRTLVFDKWSISIDKYPTIPSLAFAIYRSGYMPENTIPLTNGKVFNFIQESFTGGSTEMYKPHGKNLFCYDVNSLYPSVMKDNLFPCGNIIQFEGDITLLSKEMYWFADADVKTFKDLYQPYLQLHYKTNGGMRTVAPNGSFSMKINSSEYFHSLKDYDILIKNGYVFKSINIFKDYVEEMYSLRLQYSKADPMNYIAKLLMNSLYGRFAMKPINNEYAFCNWEEFMKLSEKCVINDYIQFNPDSLFVDYTDSNQLEKDHKVSIGISSAVTAYARILMSKFKNNPKYNLYYTDTDSIFVDKKLDDELVGDKLGQFKLECCIQEAIFLAPKIYAYKTDDSQFICKVKGYKDSSSISFDNMKDLLKKDSELLLNHVKWFRDPANAIIEMKKQLYTLKKTENKRELIVKSGISIDTKAFKI